ncbi:MAG: glycoside hydrolase family 2 protein, partial [Bacteroidota bacterium]
LFAKPKALVLPDPKLSWEIVENNKQPILIIHCNAFAHKVYLEWAGTENFSNNFFDLLPSEGGMTISLPPGTDVDRLKETLKVRSFYDLQR